MEKPTIVVALFMKYMEAYCRCVDGAKNGNTWLMKIEGCHWLGVYKVAGKTNYVTETLYRMDTLYGDRISDKELEWKRCNQLYTMTDGDHSMSLDEMNEFLNLWNKGIVTSPILETVCKDT